MLFRLFRCSPNTLKILLYNHKNKRTAFPRTYCDSDFWFSFTIYQYFLKRRTIGILPLSGEAREFLGLSRSSPKKGEERSIKVLTSSPKTIKLNLQLIEEDVIITNWLLEKGLTWSRSTLQNPLLGRVKM